MSKRLKRGDLYPVWWDTEDGRPGGEHRARVIEIRPYTGKFTGCFTNVLVLAAPRTRAGRIEMAVDINDPHTARQIVHA